MSEIQRFSKRYDEVLQVVRWVVMLAAIDAVGGKGRSFS
jgi:hypothetical protein